MQLAQLNYARAKYSLESKQLSEFIENLEPINAIAEQSPGFIWRLLDTNLDGVNEAEYLKDNTIFTVSVWQDLDSLKNFMFKTHHLAFVKRKSEWFEKINEANYVLWWVEDGHIPTIAEGIERLEYLRTNGESDYAFGFSR